MTATAATQSATNGKLRTSGAPVSTATKFDPKAARAAARRVEIESESTESKSDALTEQRLIEAAFDAETGLAILFSEIHSGKKLFNHTSGQWLDLVEGVFMPDEVAGARCHLLDTLKPLYKDLAQTLGKREVEATAEGEGEAATLKKQRAAALEALKRLNSVGFQNSILEVAKSYLKATQKDFDSAPGLLNLKNGVYDFDRCIFRGHAVNDRFMKQSAVSYDAKAGAPEWSRFLDLIFCGDKDLIRYMRMLVGYSLTGYTDLNGFYFCYGNGANGKSTFFSVVEMLAGDFFVKTVEKALLKTGKDDATKAYSIARLDGARVVLGPELEANRRLNESVIKDMTGNDLITARHIYGKEFQFRPQYKLFIFGNHEPHITGTDDGIWRRVKKIPFNFQFKGEVKKDSKEVLDSFRRELPGILNWAIDGWKDYKNNGYFEPGAVVLATEEYRKDSDVLGGFISERTTEGNFEYADGLYAAYIRYCETSGEVQAFRTSRAFNKAVEKKGFKKSKGTGNKPIFIGLALMKDTDEVKTDKAETELEKGIAE